MTDHHQAIKDCLFIAREKLDGTNIQLYLTPNQEMCVGKRTQFLTKGESFFDIWTTLTRYSNTINSLQSWCNSNNKTLRVFGELYGPGINGRIDYGMEKQICFFDAEIDDVLLTQVELEDFLAELDLFNMLPKEIKLGTLEGCLNCDVDSGIKMEGIVIKPYEYNFYSQRERFIIKKKSKAFADKEGSAPVIKELKYSDEIYSIQRQFKSYITKNRVLDVCSKHGMITEMNQLGTYINYVLDDAREDFLKDFPEIKEKQFSKEDEKFIYSAGHLIVNILNELM